MDKIKTLSNGVVMPKVGLGVWQADNDKEAQQAVEWAIESGYRAIDTAMIYRNEESVGRALKNVSVPREDIFVTSKVWNDDQGYETTLKAFDESMAKLQLDYLDLYLIHWPLAETFQETWRALETLYNDGRVRAIGVSNFEERHLKKLAETAKITPMVDQMELHPYLSQVSLRKYLAERNIAVEAYSPLGHGHLLEEKTLKEIAEKYRKTSAQVILRWDLQHDIITIPKSVHQSRIKENIDLFDFDLTAEEMEKIDHLNQNQRFNTDPQKYDK